MNAFIPVKSSVLEKALNYLACPNDNSELQLYMPRRDFVTEGEFSCRECGSTYEIDRGIPIFSERVSIPELPNIEGIKLVINDYMVIGIPPSQLPKVPDINEIRAGLIRDVMKEAVDEASGLGEQESAERLQRATMERYNLENYSGTWKVPADILAEIESRRVGAVVEGGCGPGDCLLDIQEVTEYPFYIGADISETMIREAAKMASLGRYDNILFVQGDVRKMPVGTDKASLYVVNNVWDRVPSPRETALEGKRILDGDGSVIFANCQPMQFEYERNGSRIVYVPESQRLTLEEASKLAGCEPVVSRRYDLSGNVWRIQTLLDGPEELPMEVVYGVRR